MEAEIAEQPKVLAENGSRYFAQLQDMLAGRQFEMVLLAARGSSDNAALYGRYLIEINLQIPVSLAAPSVLTRYGSHVRYPKCLAVGISQSGEAPDVAEVLSALRMDGHTTLPITNTPGSRLEREAEFCLQLGVGNELSVAATKTYTASLLALYQMVRALQADLPGPTLPDDAWVRTCALAAGRDLEIVLQNPVLFALARGYSFCSAQETALKLMECALLPCKAYSTADFEHGPKALATAGSAAVVFGETPAGLEATGCKVIRAPESGASTQLSPFFEVVFGQYLALYAARERSLDPDRPRNLHKVTKTR